LHTFAFNTPDPEPWEFERGVCPGTRKVPERVKEETICDNEYAIRNELMICKSCVYARPLNILLYKKIVDRVLWGK
jgi:hypothetical protein